MDTEIKINELSGDVARLQQRADDRDREHGQLRESVNTMREMLASMNTSLNVFITEVRNTSRCPHPGMCIQLQGQCKDIQCRVEEMENERREIRGGWKLVVLVFSAGASVSGFLTWLVTHFKP